MSDKQYDLKSVDLPRLSGIQLRVFVNLLESPLTRWLLIGQLLRTGGVTRLKQLVIEEPPTYYPPASLKNLQSSSHHAPQGLSEELIPLADRRQPGLPFDTAYDYTEAYTSGEISPEEVADKVLEAIEDSDRGDPPLRAFVANRGDDVRQQAQASGQRYKEGRPLSLLDGVPVAIKDEVDMLGYGTTLGTSFLGHSPADRDATPVARLRSAGALLLGKANMHEIGIGVTGQNPHHGTVRNPYHPGHHTGGSSSGPAAAVAAGLCPLALGADGGGSIRMPASFCGVVGLKPTYGRISEYGAAPLGVSVGHLGPIGATARDAALGYLTMSGPDAKDLRTLNQPAPSVQGFGNFDLSGLTLGVYWPWFNHATLAMVEGCKQMLDAFEDLGARIQEVEIPDLDAARIAHVVTIGSEIANAMDSYYEDHQSDFSLEIRINLALARSFQSLDYLKAQQVRTRTINNFERILEQVDVIATPTVGLTAPPIKPDAIAAGDSDLSLLTEIMRFVTPANLTGHPAITFPVGYDPISLPVGIQLMGRSWHEHVLLRLANAAEGIVERKPPQINYRILG